MPKQLTAGALDGAPSGDVSGGVAVSNGSTAARTSAPKPEHLDGNDPTTAKQAGAPSLTYNDIADQLERDLKARGL